MQRGPSLGTQHQLQPTAKKLHCSLGLAGSDARKEALVVFRGFSGSMSLREMTGPRI